MLLSALGLGLHQTLQHLYEKGDSFEQFENWIIETTGGPDPIKIGRFNALFTGKAAKLKKLKNLKCLALLTINSGPKMDM